MKTHLNIVILDTNRYFSQGLEAVLQQYFMHRGHPPAVFSNSYNENADLVFQSHSLLSTALCCHADTPMPQYRIAIQDSPFPRLRVCFGKQSPIRCHIEIDTLLAEVARLLASPAPTPAPQRCPHCTSALTVRERQVLLALSLEQAPQQIANTLQLSNKTVSAHKCAAMEKLGFTRSSELYHWLRQGGLDIKWPHSVE